MTENAHRLPAVLLTQCLQNDFVKAIARHAPLPNRLHIGAEESLRLMGEDPAEGPVARMMQWAYDQPPEELMLIHIRDWHSSGSAAQREHLRQFGEHCLEGTEGADFAFAVPANARARPVEIRSLGLNDFEGTRLAEALTPSADRDLNAGIMGVWTEAKIFFLAYELRTRYPRMNLAVCSALTASSSRAQHFMALEQLRRLLGVRVCDSVGEFIEFLGGQPGEVRLAGLHEAYPAVQTEGGAAPLQATDEQILRYLFRDCRRVSAKVLDGGFSGNVVLGTSSVDLHGHEQVVHVVKIGPRNAIGQERTAFERIEEVLGNNAPRISDFADLGERGAVKYRYASMGGGKAVTFQKQYMGGMPLEKVRDVLHAVFVEQLGRLYGAAEQESCNLLEYYGFDSRWAPNVRRRVERITGRPADGDAIALPSGRSVPNLCRFYEADVPAFDPLRRDHAYFATVHGDLNGANIILDAHENVWLIDFFHTHRGHVLRDLVKLENDLLYIFTPVADRRSLEEGMRLSDFLLAVPDLGADLPPAADSGFAGTAVERAYETVRILRGFYPRFIRTNRSPLQWVIAAMRYAVHTLSFDESSEAQKEWALYTAALCGEKIRQTLENQKTLRIDRLDASFTGPGALGLTILPGRRDYGRDLAEDLAVVKEGGISAVVCLLPQDELVAFGVPDLLERYAAAGLEVYHLPIVDQGMCSVEAMRQAGRWVDERVVKGARVLVHCTGGLGRSGCFAACWLVSRGLTAEAAIAEVRHARTARAIESRLQEAFIRRYAPEAGGHA